MSYKNKSNKISEQEVAEDSINLIELISDYKSLTTRIKELEKAIKFIKSYSGPGETTDLVSEQETQNSEEDMKIKKLMLTRENLIKSLAVIGFLKDWLLSSEKFVAKATKGKGFVSKTLNSLGNFLSLLTEEELPKPEVNLQKVQDLLANLGDKKDLFVISLKQKRKDVPKEAIKFILDQMPPEYHDAKVYDILINKPSTLGGIVDKTNSAISTIIAKSYKDIRNIEKVQKAIQKTKGDDELGISDEEAQALAALLELSDDDEALEEAKNIERVLSQDNIEKLFRQKKISQSQHDLLMGMLKSKLAQAKQFIEKRQAAKTKDPEKKKAAQQKQQKPERQEITSIEQIEALHTEIPDTTVMEDILNYLNNSDDRNDFYLKYKDNLSPISAFIPSRSAKMRDDKKLVAIYPKIAGAATKSPMPYVQIENGIIVVDKGMVALKKDSEATKEPEGPKQYPGTEIELTEEGDEQLLNDFFEFIRSRFPPITEAIKYGYIQRKTNNALTAKLLRDAISDYIDDLPKSQRNRLNTLIKSEAVDISKYIAKLFNERGQPEETDQAQGDEEATDSTPEPSEESEEDEKKKVKQKVTEINNDIKAGIPWVLITSFGGEEKLRFDITEISVQPRNQRVALYYKEGTGKSGRLIDYPTFLELIEDELITKKAEEQESPTSEEIQQDVDDAAEAARKAEEEAKTEAERKAAEEAAKKAAEAKRKAEEAEELEKQRKAEEAEKARLEAEAAAKAAEEESAKVIPLKQKAQEISDKFKLRQSAKETEGYEALKSSWDSNYAGKGHIFDTDLQAFVDFFGQYGYHRKGVNESEKDISKLADKNDYIKMNKSKLIGAYKDKSLDPKKKAQIDRIMTAILKGAAKDPEKVKVKLEDIIYNIVKNPEKSTRQEPKDEPKKAAENIERLLSPLVREVVRRKWQKRIT